MSGLTPGASFGKYRILRLVGRGGMGVVYLAEDQMLERRVALKVLDRGVTAAEDFAHRFRQEARTIAGLNHPNIVQIHSLEKIDDDLAIDMPFIEGGSLADNDRIHRVPAPELLNIARDVLLALACCHESGIVHRDVKPSNILLASDGRALLSDFGLAKILSVYQSASLHSASSSGFFLGTPRYAPPEAWDGQEPTPAWDVYSLGLILFEGISGYSVYDAQTPLSLMKQMLERPVPRLDEVCPGVSKELSDLLAMSLQRSVEQRPQDAGEVLESLLQLPEMCGRTDDRSVTIPKVPRRKLRRKAARPAGQRRDWRSRVFLAAMAITISALITSIGWSLFYAKRTRTANTRPPGSISVPEASISEDYRVFDTVEPASRRAWTGNLLMLAGRGTSASEFLAYTATSVWYGELTSDSGTNVTVDGFFAEYADESARIFRHGTVAGTGNWMRAGSTLALSAVFVCTQDGSRISRSFILNAAEQPPTFPAFVRGLESAAGVQALLFNELAPRHALWNEQVERRFLAPVSTFAHVPLLRGEDSAITLDGRLEEKPWQDAFRSSELLGESGVVTGLVSCTSRPALGRIALHYSDNGLYLAVQLDIPLRECQMDLSISEHPAVPIARAPRRFAQFRGGDLQVSYFEEYGSQADWTCDWKSRCIEAAGKMQIECFVSFAGFATRDRPEAGTRWRLCAAVSDAAVPDAGPLAVWGPANVREIEHGVLLVFGS